MSRWVKPSNKPLTAAEIFDMDKAGRSSSMKIAPPMKPAPMTDSAVRFISPDSTWTIFWRFLSKRRRFGALAMVKWRAWGIGVEWFGFNWLGIFVGPFCLAFGRIEPASNDGEARTND